MVITDFDGVLCDSVQECLLVTYNAYRKLQSASAERILSITAIAPHKQAQFRALRPYLKGAEDFVPMFIAIEEQIPITGQQEFNALRTTHKDRLADYQAAFYTERDFLQRHEKDLWLSLNPLFDGIGEILKQCSSFENIHILTTKRQQDVIEIFNYQGIPFPAEQITYSKTDAKSQKLFDLLHAYGVSMEETVYIEDQVDFLVESSKHGIQSYLVEWGYVSEEQKALARTHHIPIIGIEQWRELLCSYFH